jgi:hypothetical protein
VFSLHQTKHSGIYSLQERAASTRQQSPWGPMAHVQQHRDGVQNRFHVSHRVYGMKCTEVVTEPIHILVYLHGACNASGGLHGPAPAILSECNGLFLHVFNE